MVRNLDSGEVEVLAQGDPASLERLRIELQRGPVGSRVTGVQESEAPEGRLRGFTITD
jgi:acylphosphatase